MQTQSLLEKATLSEQEKALSPKDCPGAKNPGGEEGTEGSGKWEGYDCEILNAMA